MARLLPMDPEAMDERQRELYLRFASGERADPSTDFSLVGPDGTLTGPPATWLLSPAVGLALEGFGGQIRFGLRLSPRSREGAILMVAHDERNPFEVHAHVRAGRRAGLEEHEIEAIAAGGTADARNDEERAVFAVVARLLAARTLTDAEYGEAVAVLGQDGLFELVTLVGYYRLLALQLNVFAVEPPVEAGEIGEIPVVTESE